MKTHVQLAPDPSDPVTAAPQRRNFHGFIEEISNPTNDLVVRAKMEVRIYSLHDRAGGVAIWPTSARP
jgi:hypothetical protein